MTTKSSLGMLAVIVAIAGACGGSGDSGTSAQTADQPAPAPVADSPTDEQVITVAGATITVPAGSPKVTATVVDGTADDAITSILALELQPSGATFDEPVIIAMSAPETESNKLTAVIGVQRDESGNSEPLVVTRSRDVLTVEISHFSEVEIGLIDVKGLELLGEIPIDAEFILGEISLSDPLATPLAPAVWEDISVSPAVTVIDASTLRFRCIDLGAFTIKLSGTQRQEMNLVNTLFGPNSYEANSPVSAIATGTCVDIVTPTSSTSAFDVALGMPHGDDSPLEGTILASVDEETGQITLSVPPSLGAPENGFAGLAIEAVDPNGVATYNECGYSRDRGTSGCNQWEAAGFQNCATVDIEASTPGEPWELKTTLTAGGTNDTNGDDVDDLRLDFGLHDNVTYNDSCDVIFGPSVVGDTWYMVIDFDNGTNSSAELDIRGALANRP